MSDNYSEFWAKFNKLDQAHTQYELNEINAEMLITLCFTKVYLDTTKAYSKFQNYNVDNALKYINKNLKKFPRIWSQFDHPNYYNCLKDATLRKKFLYEILNQLL